MRHRKATISTDNYNTIVATIPNRLAYLDGIECDLGPLPASNPVSLFSSPGSIVSGLRVFPNPTNGLVSIDGLNEGKFSVSDLTGRVVLRGQLSRRQPLDLSTLSPGVYAVVITSENRIGQQKVVVK